MKLAPIADELARNKKYFTHIVLHTGQHYDYELSQVFFKDLELPEPNIYLGVGSSSHAVQTSAIMLEFEKIVLAEKPDLVIVYGDVNSTMACSLVCSKIMNDNGKMLPVAHVESGLRSFDNSMPEEINRIVTDNLSEFLFVTEKVGATNLLKEGIPRKKVFLTGDTMIDSLIHNRKKIDRSRIHEELGVSKGKYVLATIHRPVNVDTEKNLKKIIAIFEKISRAIRSYDSEMVIVFPVHPRTLKMVNTFHLTGRLAMIENLQATASLSYVDFIKLLSDCKFVLTDSGGIQEEATFLKIPCLTLRDSFERAETLKLGTNTLCSLDEKLILRKTRAILDGKYKKGKIPRLMDGKASKRIVKVLLKAFV